MTSKETLTKNLEEMISILEKNNRTHWSSWLKKSLDEINKSDLHGVKRFLDAFGGMGSLNDCYLDAHFNALASESYSLAVALLREHGD